MAKKGQFKINIIPDEENAPPRIYANGAIINHSEFDFTINFWDYAAPLKAETEAPDKPIDLLVPIVARIAIAPPIMKKFVEALNENLKKYEKVNKKSNK